MEALQNITITYFPRLSSATSELRLPWNAWTVVPTILLLVIGFFLTMGGVFSKNHMPVDGKVSDGFFTGTARVGSA